MYVFEIKNKKILLILEKYKNNYINNFMIILKIKKYNNIIKK